MDTWPDGFGSASSFLPQGYCYLWQPTLIGLHLVSALITAACYAILFLLLSFVRRRQDVPFHRMFGLFGLFIFACGTTHLFEIWTLWQPTYWVSGGVKSLTGVVSVATALLLIPLIPQALALRGTAELERINQALEAEIDERKRVNEQLRNRERLLQECQRLAHLGSWKWEIATDTLRRSEELYRIYGIMPQDAPSYDTFIHAVHPEDRERVQRVIMQASQTP